MCSGETLLEDTQFSSLNKITASYSNERVDKWSLHYMDDSICRRLSVREAICNEIIDMFVLRTFQFSIIPRYLVLQRVSEMIYITRKH